MTSLAHTQSRRLRIPFARVITMMAAAGLVMVAFADTAAAQKAKPAVAPESHHATRFGGATRFMTPMKDVAALQKMLARPRMQADIRKAFAEAGIESVTDQFLKAVADGAVVERSVPVGSQMEWMTSRSARTRQPHAMRNVTWAGKKPFDAFEVVIDDMNHTYTFWIPKVCGNVGVSVTEPSREKARLDALAAEKARVEAEQKAREAAAAEKARQDAIARQKAEQARIEQEKAAAAAAAATAAEKVRLEAEQKAREAAAAAAAEADRLEKLQPFFAGYFGKERRVRETGQTATTPAQPIWEGICAPLFGFKGGVAFRVNKARTFEVAPAVGVAINTKKGSYSSLFAELELNGRFNNMKTYVGTGLGVWDLTHSDTVTPTVLVNFGQQIWQNQTTGRLFFTVEGRSFLKTESGGLSSNYQYWAGARYMWR
ncbi:MAG: hypothetical protein IMZ55_05210 [Acidobacteria bacterium]|nr:hypothetical protein [Acidobacteriota bacterium]